MTESIKLILFDVGGVLCELGQDPVPVEWIPGDRRFSLDDWFHNELALAFEKGQVTAEVLAAAFRKDLGITQSVEEILEHFDDWLIGPYPGVFELLEAIPTRYRKAILSNTNSLHWPKISNEFGFHSHFERIYSSHLMGLAKPDPKVFRMVVNDLDVPAGEVLFLDDNRTNVNAAASIGIQSVLVQGAEQMRDVLTQQGVLEP